MKIEGRIESINSAIEKYLHKVVPQHYNKIFYNL